MGHYRCRKGFRDFGGFLPPPCIKARGPGVRITRNPGERRAVTQSRWPLAGRNAAHSCFCGRLFRSQLMQNHILWMVSIFPPTAELFNSTSLGTWRVPWSPTDSTRGQGNNPLFKGEKAYHSKCSGEEERRKTRAPRSLQDQNGNAVVRKKCLFHFQTQYYLPQENGFKFRAIFCSY